MTAVLVWDQPGIGWDEAGGRWDDTAPSPTRRIYRVPADPRLLTVPTETRLTRVET